MPTPAPHKPDDATLKNILANSKTIAVVGLSPKLERDSFRVARYLQGRGYEIIPVNPGQREILGQTCHPDVTSIPGPVEVVNVFRRPEACPEVARQAVAKGAKVLWMQLGITSAEARRIAEDAGLTVVENACIMVEHGRLLIRGA